MHRLFNQSNIFLVCECVVGLKRHTFLLATNSKMLRGRREQINNNNNNVVANVTHHAQTHTHIIIECISLNIDRKWAEKQCDYYKIRRMHLLLIVFSIKFVCQSKITYLLTVQLVCLCDRRKLYLLRASYLLFTVCVRVCVGKNLYQCVRLDERESENHRNPKC